MQRLPMFDPEDKALLIELGARYRSKGCQYCGFESPSPAMFCLTVIGQDVKLFCVQCMAIVVTKGVNFLKALHCETYRGS